MDKETEITQSFEPVPPPAGPAGPPPPRRPPRFLFDDVWGWLAVLLVVVVGGLLLWLLVLHSRGSGKHVVPAVVGLQQQAAIDRLTGDGYAVKAFVGPAAQPRGIVVSQTPGGGSQLDKGATVTIRISNGRSLGVTTSATTTATTPATTTTQQTAARTQVPDVVGQDMTSGAGQIEALGLVAETAPLDSSTDPEGQIVQQTPAAGAQAAPGSTVQLQVSPGTTRSPVQVPDVVGEKAGSARVAIEQAKLTVRTEYRAGDKQHVGAVVAQSPAAGQSSPAYTQVTLTVGR